MAISESEEKNLKALKDKYWGSHGEFMFLFLLIDKLCKQKKNKPPWITIEMSEGVEWWIRMIMLVCGFGIAVGILGPCK